MPKSKADNEHAEAYQTLQNTRREIAEEREHINASVESAQTALHECQFLRAKRDLNDSLFRQRNFDTAARERLEKAEQSLRASLPPGFERVRKQLNAENRRLESFSEEALSESDRQERRRRIERCREGILAWRKSRQSADPMADAIAARDAAIGNPDLEDLWEPELITERRGDSEPAFNDFR